MENTRLPKVREVIVVEGKYDRIRLSSVVDALIVETHGFRIFREPEQRTLIRTLANQRGLLILTDSDAAGFVIRSHLDGLVPPALVKHAYIPELRGRERRKAVPSKEGLLGVEGMRDEVLLAALRRAGATFLTTDPAGMTADERDGAPLTKMDLYEAGLTGAPDSAQRRAALMSSLGFPTRLNANRLLAVLNGVMSRREFETWVENSKREQQAKR